MKVVWLIIEHFVDECETGTQDVPMLLHKDQVASVVKECPVWPVCPAVSVL